MVDIIRATVKGTVSNTDIFMFGMAFQSEDSPIDFLQHHSGAFTGRLGGWWGDSTTFTSLRADQVDEATGNVTASDELPLAVSQGGGGNALPPEVAVVCTIRTATPGLTGRFYLPAPTTAHCAAAGRVSLTWLDDVLEQLWELFQNDLGDSTYVARLGVYSRATHSFHGATAIDIGNVFDAQRRRRNRISEVRHSYNIA